MTDDIIFKMGEAIDKKNLWSFYHEFCQNLPDSKISYEKLTAFIPKLTVALGNDWAIGELHQSIKGYSANNIESNLNFFDSLINSDNEYLQRFAPNAFDAIVETHGTNRAWDHLQKKIFVEQIKVEALEALYRMDFELFSEKDKEKNIDSLRPKLNELRKSDNSELQGYALMLYAKFCAFIPEAKETISALAKIEHIRIQSSIKHVLDKKIIEDSELFRTLLLSLVVVDSERELLIRSIESDVLTLFETDKGLAEEFLTEWVIRRSDKNGSEIKNLSYLFQELYKRHNATFKKILTKWLNHDDKAFHRACKVVSSEFFISRIYDLELDKEALLDFEIRDIRFITSKILGFIFARQHLRSLLYSILATRDDDLSHDIIVSSYTEYVMVNYPSTKDYLLEKRLSAREATQKAIDTIINISDQYFEAIHNLPICEELKGSQNFAREYNKAQSKLHSEAMKKPMEGSISSLFRNINIKAGNSWFHRDENGYSDKSRFGEVTMSDELPRAERINQYGMSLARLHWTIEERK